MNNIVEAIEKLNVSNEDIEMLMYITADIMDDNIRHNAFDIVEIMATAKKDNLDERDFFVREYPTDNIEENIKKAIKYGDYITAYEMLKQIDVNYSFEFQVYKALLEKLVFILSTNKVTTNNESVEELVSDEDYVSAFRSYYDNDLNDPKVLALLAKQAMDMEQKAEALEEKYRESLKNKDYAKACEYLNKYKEYISGTGLDREIDYLYNRITLKAEEESMHNYKSKMVLYNKAKKMYLDHEDIYEVIELLNKYIAIDDDISFRGYLLRGRAYLVIGEYDLALRDFLKAYLESGEPNAIIEIAKEYYRRGLYYNSLMYYEEFEKRRKERYSENLETMITLYQKFNKNAEAEQCRKALKRVQAFENARRNK